ncbi:MAG TPA: hypothetical protein VHV09_09875, partial [Trebonia sp.]|nr:hypothetical protein [Trebonia sp.]
MSASPPIGTVWNGPASGCTWTARCTSPHRQRTGSGPAMATAAVQPAASAAGSAASTRSRRTARARLSGL